MHSIIVYHYKCLDVGIGDVVSDSIGSGQFRFYILPFLTAGVTVRVEVFRGGVWCYASDTNCNPNSGDYIWRLFISDYNDSYIDPTSLGRTVGSFLFIAIEGTGSTNDFALNSTINDTSISSKSCSVRILLVELLYTHLVSISVGALIAPFFMHDLLLCRALSRFSYTCTWKFRSL